MYSNKENIKNIEQAINCLECIHFILDGKDESVGICKLWFDFFRSDSWCKCFIAKVR